MTAQTSTQAQVIPKFGEQKKAFSIDELKRLINAAKNMRDLNQAKGYLCSYFIPSPTRMESSCGGQKSKTSSTSLIKILINLSVQLPNTVCVATCDPQKSRIFKLGGQLYLNIFPGFLHILRPISTFESTTHLAVKFIFFHIQDIWCSGDWNLTEYIIKWLAGVAAGRKMYSILYLKSGQGWGKSIITDFIQRSVLGTQLVYKTSDPQTILGSFNGQLQGASEAFYAYLRAIADAYPDFNGNPPPMTTSKQDHIILTLPPLFQFIKDTYLIVKNHITDLPVQEFYRVYTSYCETHCITPLSKINASRILSNELGINSRKIRVGKATPRVYNIFRKDLYKKFLTKKWIHKTDEINIEGIDVETPEKPASDPNALVKFLANIYNPASKSQVDQEEVELVVEKPVEERPTEKQPVAKKAPLPVPPKPDCLKVKPAPVIKEDHIPEESPSPIESDTDEIIDSFSDCYLSDEKPDQENEPPAEEPAFEADDDYDVLDDLLSDSDPTTADQVPEQQPESPAESSAKSESLADSKSSTEPVVELTLKEQPIPEPDTELEVDWDPEPKEGTRAHWAWHERHRWDHKPWVKNSKDQVFNDLYNTGKDLWAKYQNASDEYDWEILAFEVEECLTTRIEDEYQYYFKEVVDHFKDWIEYNENSPKTPSRKELANLIRVYKEDRDAEIIPTTSGYETIKMNKGKA
ncbi:uncharacterized protein OCT59_014774 [Rhizophagus irregularis]|uniref:uncharacterized protein n=1 Tax=Rhizophagus irregularis TaxID=588596 RepID=UPI003321448C|nr:hypothetical protein OCT59_014774 [Rhizophagus irregularis]